MPRETFSSSPHPRRSGIASRERIVAFLRDRALAGEPAPDIGAVSVAIGLSRSAVRAHVRVLVGAGVLIEREEPNTIMRHALILRELDQPSSSSVDAGSVARTEEGE